MPTVGSILIWPEGEKLWGLTVVTRGVKAPFFLVQRIEDREGSTWQKCDGDGELDPEAEPIGVVDMQADPDANAREIAGIVERALAITRSWAEGRSMAPTFFKFAQEVAERSQQRIITGTDEAES